MNLRIEALQKNDFESKCTGCDSTCTYDSAIDSSLLNVNGKSSRETSKRGHACFRNKYTTRLKHPSAMVGSYVCAVAYGNETNVQNFGCADVSHKQLAHLGVVSCRVHAS
jgi:hypothetical protein